MKLPLCKVNQDFAKQHGIEEPVTQAAPVRTVNFAPTPPAPIRSQTFTREGDTIIVTPAENIKDEPIETPSDSNSRPALRETLLDRIRATTQNRDRGSNTDTNDACRGKLIELRGI